MRYEIIVPRGAERWHYTLLGHGNYQTIDVDGVLFMQICKIHNHRYDLQAFFYRQKVIIGSCSFGTKKELYGAIQKLLQEYL